MTRLEWCEPVIYSSGITLHFSIIPLLKSETINSWARITVSLSRMGGERSERPGQRYERGLGIGSPQDFFVAQLDDEKLFNKSTRFSALSSFRRGTKECAIRGAAVVGRGE